MGVHVFFPMPTAPRTGEYVLAYDKAGYWDVVCSEGDGWWGMRRGGNAGEYLGWTHLDATPDGFFNFDVLGAPPENFTEG